MFTDIWLKRLLLHWNSSRVMRSLLKQENFTATIGYGLVDSPNPIFVLEVKSGRLEKILKFTHQDLDWDLRATLEDWEAFIKKPPNITQLGLAYTQKRLICRKGNYSDMIKNVNLSKAFSHSFQLMHQAEAA